MAEYESEEEEILLLLLLRRMRRRQRAASRNTWVKTWILRRRSQGAFLNLVQELNAEDPENFRRFHRVDRASFNDILSMVSPYIIIEPTIMKSPISPSERLSVTLHFLATATYIGQKRAEENFATPTAKRRPIATSTPLQRTARTQKLFKKKAARVSCWDPIVTNIKYRKYSAAIRGLYKATAGTKQHFHIVVRNIVRNEIKQLLQRSDFPLCKEATIGNITDFSWDSTLSMVQSVAPLTYEMLCGIATLKAGDAALTRGGRINLKPIVGCSLAALLHAKAPRKATFIPTMFSLQLWRGGLKRSTLKQLSHTGYCLGYKGTVSAIDKIRKSFDEVATASKKQLEVQLSKDVKTQSPLLSTQLQDDENTHDSEKSYLSGEENVDEDDDDWVDEEESVEDVEECTDDSLEGDIEADISNISGVEKYSNEDLEIFPPEDELHPGFTTCWDNVGKKVVTRHPTADRTNTYINMALGYLAINRVPVTHLDAFVQQKKASEIHPGTFIANDEDFCELDFRINTIIGRILTRHCMWFSDNLSNEVVPHILHPHSGEMRHKSILVNLGVFDENPSTTQGAIGIYRNLQGYVPNINGKPLPTVVYGDGLSCERGNDARKALCNGLNAWERLEGLEPSPQEFHKEMLLLQDYYDEFFNAKSATDRGTIYHVRNILNFRQVKKDIGNCFSDGWELMSVMTESFVCHLAMTMLQMTETTDRPGNAPEHIEDASDEDKRKYLADTTRKLTEFLAFKLDTNALRLQDNPHGTGTNCCEEDTDEDLVCCAAGIRCARGQWFHYSCAGLDIEHLPEEFYCSDECRSLETGHSYQYCTCKCDLGDLEPMVGCAAGSRCVRCEWYHTKCLEINIEDLPKGDWFCSEECRVLKKKTSLKSSPERKDYKNEYSRAMTWCGLNLLCRRDAVREGDGEAMIRYWRLDLAHFFATRHPKYVILAHRLICATHGWLPEKLQEEIIWNRTVNYSGGKGRNLPMDLMNEILNRLFKDMLEGSKGRYTEETIQRCGQLVGPLGEALDKVFDENVIERELYSHRRRSQNRDRNVKTLVALLQQEQLFAVIPGRQHKAFPEFSHNINPKQPEKFLPKMKQLSTRLDKCRDIILDE